MSRAEQDRTVGKQVRVDSPNMPSFQFALTKGALGDAMVKTEVATPEVRCPI